MNKIGQLYFQGLPSARLLLATVVIFSAIFGSCKKEDRDPPSVAISAPSSGFVIQGNSKFLVQGRASDETALGNITATILDLSSGSIIASKSDVLEGVEDNFSIEISAGNRYTESNAYMLRVTAQDLAGNSGSGFSNIQIVEFPLKFQGLYFASNPNLNIWNTGAWIKATDTSSELRTGPSGLQAVSGILSDDRNGFFAMIQSGGGRISAYDQLEFDPIFERELNEGGTFPVLVDLDMLETSYITAAQVPPYLRLFRFDGGTKGDFEDMLYPGTAVLVTDTRVYAGAKGILGSPIKLDAYNIQNEALAASLLMDWEVLELLELNTDQIAAFGNKNGIGYIDVIDRQSFTKDWALQLDGEFVAAASANGHCWIVTNNGMKEIFPATGTFSSFLATGTYFSVAADKKSNQVYLGKSGEIEIRSSTGTQIGQIVAGSGPIRMLRSVYNK